MLSAQSRVLTLGTRTGEDARAYIWTQSGANQPGAPW